MAASSARRRMVAVLVSVAILAPVAIDLARPAHRQVSARLLVGAIHVYQRTLSPGLSWVGARCRFEPTCSRYAEAVISRLGTVRGLALTGRRLARCGPWTAPGTADPPPGVQTGGERDEGDGFRTSDRL